MFSGDSVITLIRIRIINFCAHKYLHTSSGHAKILWNTSHTLKFNIFVHFLAIPDTSRLVKETEICEFKNKFVWAMWAVGDHFYKAFVDDVKGMMLSGNLTPENPRFEPFWAHFAQFWVRTFGN